MAEILIADDERIIREGMRAFLVGEGFSVRTARDGEDALKKFSERRPDLVLLDVMIPKMNGFHVCGEIRRTDRLVPILFLTAKDAEADQVRGLGLGADDYIAKSAGEPVLLARIRRALDRTQAVTASADVLRLGPVTVDFVRLRVCEGDRELALLTKTEGNILRFLASEWGIPRNGDEIIAVLRGDGFACEDGMLYTHLSRLRRKLGPAGNLLVNDRGSGYRLV